MISLQRLYDLDKTAGFLYRDPHIMQHTLIGCHIASSFPIFQKIIKNLTILSGVPLHLTGCGNLSMNLCIVHICFHLLFYKV